MTDKEYMAKTWAFGEDNDGWYLEEMGGDAQLAWGMRFDLARRISAALNYCAGIPVDELEKARIGEAMQ